jgi:iron complex outermembrane receptor protein
MPFRSRLLISAVATIVLAPSAWPQEDGSPPAQRTSDRGQEIETILVTGRASALYRTGEVSSGKLPTEPLLSTQTIQVINAQLIEDQGARDAQDLYRNISGVSVFSYAGVTARGFRQEENFYDGLRGDPYSGFSVPQLFNIERVEFLKGPAGMLYGPGAPGGLFNYITKQPEEAFSARLSSVVGTEARYGVSGEITGAITGPVSGRAGVFHEQRNQPRRNADSEITIADAGLRFDLGRGGLVFQATRYEQDLGGNRLRGVPTDDLGNFLADRRWNHNEASDFLRLESDVLQVKADYALTDSLQIDGGLRWNSGTETQQYHEPFGPFDTNGDGELDTISRQFRDQRRETEALSAGLNAIWSVDTGPVANRVLIGGDWYRAESLFDGRSVNGTAVDQPGRPTPLRLINPDYGRTDPSSYLLPAFSRTLSEQERRGAYLLNEASWGRVIGVVGARFDRFDDTNLVKGEGFSDEAVTWRAGLVYRLTDEISLFGQWAESFEPQGIGNQDPRRGGPFEPTEGEIHEAGVRTALMNGRIQSSASLYRIVRTNILQPDPSAAPDPDGFDRLIAIGEVTSEGFEADVTADITPNWVATVSYGYNDARITGDAGTSTITNSVGDRFVNAPRHQAGFWTRYQFPAINTAVALGGDYVDVRTSFDGQKVRPYVVFDASLIYETEDWRVLLRVDNLLDETYAASGFSARTGHFPGDPRSVFVQLSRSW